MRTGRRGFLGLFGVGAAAAAVSMPGLALANTDQPEPTTITSKYAEECDHCANVFGNSVDRTLAQIMEMMQ